MRTQLFIQNYEIELNESVQFLLNKEFEHLSNPTDIINDWSKTVSIPFTEKNNKIFGYIYNPSRVIVSDGTETSYTRMGIYFDPTKKLDFKLVYNNFVLMEGYAKMLDIKMTDYTGTYNITLNGQLGKIFQELKKITFDTTTVDTKYLIHGEDYVEEYIDRNLVYNSWTGQGQTHINLMKKDNVYYNINDILGWAPNNSFSEGFDYKTYQLNDPSLGMVGKLFTDILSDSFFRDTGINPDTAIPNGLLPREIGEYRSYLQLPFIYWNKLFQMFQTKAEEITGYTFDLDDTFFTPSNPDWYNLVYMLKPFEVSKYVENNITDLVLNDTGTQHYEMGQTTTYTYSPRTDFHIPMQYRPAESNDIYDSTTELFTLKKDEGIQLKGTIRNIYTIIDRNGELTPDTAAWNLEKTAAVVNEFIFLDENNTVLSTYKFAAATDDSTVNKSEFIDITSLGTNKYFNFTKKDEITIDINYSLMLSPKQIGSQKFKIKVETYMVKNPPTPIYETADTPSFNFKVYGTDETFGSLEVYSYDLTTSYRLSELGSYRRLRSYNRFTANDLWNNDYNLFDEIIKYCKMYRIMIYTDDFEKKIYFRQQNQYFENYSVEDWTDKIDRSKEILIKPITFENKYVLFNYEDNKTKLGGEYRDKYGFDFGEYRLTTDYNFNMNTTELFKKVKTSITNTDNILSWTNLNDNHIIRYSFPAELYVYNKDKDSKQVDTFGQYYYYCGRTAFSSEASLYLRPVLLTDDTTFQQSRNNYFYTQGSDKLRPVSYYPKLDVVYGDNLCLFNTPKENYTYINNYTGKATIYSKYWEKYLNERYNIQNKVVTCYLTLTPKDWSDFRFNKFIKIDGVLYMVNKIYDYNIETPEPTKVDLITITDITGYTE